MLLTTTLLLLCSNAVTLRRDKSILYARVVITILVLCFILAINSYYWEFYAKGIGLYGGFYQATAVSHLFQIFVILITLLIVQLNGFYPRKNWANEYSSFVKLIFYKLIYYNSAILNKMSEQYRIIEYPLILLFILVGGLFLISSSDLISVFLSIELQSYGLYILCAVYRDSEKATSAALTYFLLGGLSSCFILLGSALLYGNSGNTTFDALSIIENITEVQKENLNLIDQDTYNNYYFNYSLLIISVGLLFKVSAAPFHFWSPDVYDAIPTVVTSFVAVFAKISVFVLLLELVYSTSNNLQIDNINPENALQQGKNSLFNSSWTFSLLVSSFLSLIIGAVLGLTQFRIKRLYAYSTISHVGFILLALTINTIESIQSFIFYLMQYSISNLNAFLLLITIAYSLYLYVEKTPQTNSATKTVKPASEMKDLDYSPIQLIHQLKGYFYINPLLALSLVATIFSFVGIPPLIGFFAKQMVLSSALDNGYIFISLVAILTSVISAYYYLALVKQIFFHKTDYMLTPVLNYVRLSATIVPRLTMFSSKQISVQIKSVTVTSSFTVTISLLSLIIILFIFIPQQWLSLANILAIILYIN